MTSSRTSWQLSSRLGLLLTALLLPAVCSMAQSALQNDEITITAPTQPLHTLCPLYGELMGRSLILSPRVEGAEIRLGPLTASREEMKLVLPAVLAAAGYTITKVAPSIDMLEKTQPAPVPAETPTSARIALRYANAAELVASLGRLFVPPAQTPEGQLPQSPPSVTATPDNALHVVGTAGQIDACRAFVLSMDVPSRLVSIRAIIGHVQLGAQYQTGMDWLSALDDFTVGNAGRGETDIPLRRSTQALTLYGSTRSLSRYLKLVEEDSHFRTDSRPSLFVRSGSSAEITSGQRVAYPQNVLTTSTGQASTSSTVAYQDVLLRLKVDALINSQDMITLKITQANDIVTGTSTISGNQVPNIGSQSLTTEVTLQSGSTVVLGGIVTTSQDNKERGVSKLRKLPLIGKLFEMRTKNSGEEELIILIEASVASQQAATAKR